MTYEEFVWAVANLFGFMEDEKVRMEEEHEAMIMGERAEGNSPLYVANVLLESGYVTKVEYYELTG